MFFFSVSGMLLTVPIMTVLGNTSSPWVAFGLMTFALVFVTGYTALAAIIKAEMFPTKVRALGVGPAARPGRRHLRRHRPRPIALALKQAGHETTYFWYVTACIVLTFLATFLVPEPSRTSLLETADAPAAPAPTKAAPLT